MARTPNLLVMMADQQRADTIGAGPVAAFCRTPNLDRLAAESVTLANHHANAALCVPSRNSLLTSTWPQENGAVVNGWSKAELPFGTMREGLDTVYDALARAGYDVCHMGVNHLRTTPPVRERSGIRLAASADEHRNMLASKGITRPHPPVRTPCIDFERGKAVAVTYTNPTPVVWDAPAEDFFDFWLADQVVREIESRDDERPFAFFVNFWAPHCPLASPEPYFSMYDPDAIPLPEDVGVWFPGQSPLNLLGTCGTTALNVTRDDWRRSWATYLSLVTLVDEAMGRVLKALRAGGRWDDTLVWMTGDHGEMLGSHGLFQKMCLYEHATRTPALVKPPASAGGAPSSLDGLTQHLDIAPTLLDYAGAEPLATASAGPEAGRSLRGPIEGEEAAGPRTIVMCFDGNSGRGFHQRAVLDGRYKLIHNHGIQADDPPGRFAAELYDLENDPGETRNCLNDPTDEERAAAERLHAALVDWMRRVDDLIPPPGPEILRCSLPDHT